MTYQHTSKTVKNVARMIAKECKPEKIILFGSWAWGTPRGESDMDFLIIKKSTKRRIDRERQLRSRLFGHRFPPLDLLIYTPEELNRRRAIGDFFIREILDNGKVLYTR